MQWSLCPNHRAICRSFRIPPLVSHAAESIICRVNLRFSRVCVLIQCSYEARAPTVYREEQSQGKVIVAAGLYEAEFAVTISQDEDYNLHVSGLHINRDPATDSSILDVSLASLPTVEPLAGSFPLSGYPNSISIIRQSDDNLYAIVCAGGLNGNQSFGSPPTSNVSSQLAIFKIENGRRLVKVEPRTQNWPLFESGWFVFLSIKRLRERKMRSLDISCTPFPLL
jgi:hypothetical protein